MNPRNVLVPTLVILVMVVAMLVWNTNLGQTFSYRPASITESVVQKDMALNSVLQKKIKILCWIMTNPKTINTKARAISQTWGQHCDTTLYISSQSNANPPASVVNVTEGRSHLTEKTKAAFQLIYDRYYDKADWFVKSDDDTFMILDNLRYLVAHYDPRMPIHFGHQFNDHKKTTKFVKGAAWMSGGAGYVLSREALNRFVHGMKDAKVCPYQISEDYFVSLCLESLNVVQGISADKEGRPAFLPLPPTSVNKIGDSAPPRWYFEYSIHVGKKTMFGCCSPYTISFHYIDPDRLHLFYFLVYKLRRYGLPPSDPSLVNTAFSDPEIQPLADNVHDLPSFDQIRQGKG